jgi:hypothetical protein
METPNLDYNYWLEKWYANVGNSNLSNVSYSIFRGTLNDCENEILRIVNDLNRSDADIIRAIDLINQWGGSESRYFYIAKTKTLENGQKLIRIPRELIEYPENLAIYKRGISLASENNPSSVNYFLKIFGIGASYIGKHAYFWSNYNLPIIDAKIAGVLGYNSSEVLLRNYTYNMIINHMQNIQIQNKLDELFKVEKGMFAFHRNYFDNGNTKFKSNITDFTNLRYAIYLAELFNIAVPQYLRDELKKMNL